MASRYPVTASSLGICRPAQDPRRRYCRANLRVEHGGSFFLSTEHEIIKAFASNATLAPKANPPKGRESKFCLDVITAVKKTKAELREASQAAESQELEQEKPKQKVTDRDKDSIRRQFGLPTKSATRKKAEQLFAKNKPYVPSAKRHGWT